MKASVILATICFLAVTTYTSSIRAKETEAWTEVKEGPNKGSYKGKLWGLDALARFDNAQKVCSITVNQQYPSHEDARETYEQVIGKAMKLISGYIPVNASNVQVYLDMLNGPFKSRSGLEGNPSLLPPISIKNLDNPAIRAMLEVNFNSIILELTLPFKTE